MEQDSRGREARKSRGERLASSTEGTRMKCTGVHDGARREWITLLPWHLCDSTAHIGLGEHWGVCGQSFQESVEQGRLIME